MESTKWILHAFADKSLTYIVDTEILNSSDTHPPAQWHNAPQSSYGDRASVIIPFPKNQVQLKMGP